MNILITVLTFLMVLTLITYAHLETFKVLSGTRIEFEKYMQKSERAVANALNLNKYDNTIAKKAKAGKDQQTVKAEGSPRFSWYPFIHPDNTQNQQTFNLLKGLNIKLITTLYEGNPEFNALIEKQPNLLSDFFDRLGQAVETQKDKVKVTKASDLSNIEFGDPLQDQLIYLLFEGYSKPPRPTLVIFNEMELTNTEEGEEDLEKQLQEDVYEFRSPPDQLSLLDYITVSNTKNKIRIFLAPPPVLFTLFENRDIVNQILEARVNLYKEVMRGKDQKEASEEFEAHFQAAVSADYLPFLNFAVTKVDPRSYH